MAAGNGSDAGIWCGKSLFGNLCPIPASLPFLYPLFFYDVDFQVIKFDGINEAILIESGFIMFFKFFNRGLEPDRFT